MFSLTKLWNAIATLATNVTTLAGTIAEANGALRSRLQLDAPDQEQPPQLLHQVEAEPDPVAAGSNGRRGKHTTAAK